MDTDALVEGSFRTYLRILLSRKWSVLIIMVLTIASAFVYTHRQATIYQASAQLLLQPTETQQIIDGGSFSFSTPSVPDEVQRLEGNGVAKVVKKMLGYAPGISGSELGQTDVMLVTANASTGQLAAKIANTYAQAYLSYAQSSAVSNLMASDKIIESQLTQVNQKVSNLQSQLTAASKSGNSAQETSIQSQLSSVQSEQNLLNQQANQITMAMQLSSVAAQLIATATPPSTPTQPDLKRNLLAGFVAGLILGIAFVIAREYFDDTLRSEEELHLSLSRSEKTAKTLVLGSIPFGDEMIPGSSYQRVTSIEDPTSPQAEAYRELRTSLQFLQVREPIEIVLASSPSGGEGKSTTLANLAVMLARTGKSVVMLSLDLRRPRLHEYFQVSNSVGFTSVLVGEVSLDEALVEVGGIGGLSLLSAGPLPPNPAELLSSPSAEEIIMELKDRFDVVLIDSPPILRVTDAAVISTMADTSLLVVRAGLTTRRDMVKALDAFAKIGSSVAGIIINALPTEMTYKDRYYYSPAEAIDFGIASSISDLTATRLQTNGAISGNGHSPEPKVPAERFSYGDGGVETSTATLTPPKTQVESSARVSDVDTTQGPEGSRSDLITPTSSSRSQAGGKPRTGPATGKRPVPKKAQDKKPGMFGTPRKRRPSR